MKLTNWSKLGKSVGKIPRIQPVAPGGKSKSSNSSSKTNKSVSGKI